MALMMAVTAAMLAPAAMGAPQAQESAAETQQRTASTYCRLLSDLGKRRAEVLASDALQADKEKSLARIDGGIGRVKAGMAKDGITSCPAN
jgi:hypothetical protein